MERVEPSSLADISSLFRESKASASKNVELFDSVSDSGCLVGTQGAFALATARTQGTGRLWRNSLVFRGKCKARPAAVAGLVNCRRLPSGNPTET